jgi:hypothetical protein
MFRLHARFVSRFTNEIYSFDEFFLTRLGAEARREELQDNPFLVSVEIFDVDDEESEDDTELDGFHNVRAVRRQLFPHLDDEDLLGEPLNHQWDPALGP